MLNLHGREHEVHSKYLCDVQKAVRGRKYRKPKRFKGVFFCRSHCTSKLILSRNHVLIASDVFSGAADPNQAYTDPNTQTAAPPQQTNQPAQQPGINVKSFYFP